MPDLGLHGAGPYDTGLPTPAQPGPIECDALVIGAGPVGLFQVFQLGLLGVHAQVVDSLPVPGGQCIELYADKPIYDIPAVPVCSGRELVDRLLLQIKPFSPSFHLGQTVTGLAQRSDGRFDVQTGTQTGTQTDAHAAVQTALQTNGRRHFICRSVVVAGGVGAFEPRALKVDGVARHLGSQLFYRLPEPGTAYAFSGRRVLVVGGDQAAVGAAVQLGEAIAAGHGSSRPAPAHVTLLHRRSTLNAEPALLARFHTLCSTGALHFEVGQILAIDEDDSPARRLVAVQTIDEHNTPHRLPVDRLLVQLGLSPKLGPIALWGLALARRQLVVDPAHFETSTPGIFAVGDVVTYPGKKKLILSGFHEATLAAFAAVARLRPDAPVQLQYTTTSPLLHQRLGVATPGRSG